MKPIVCSFCGKTRREVRRLVQSDKGVVICDECLTLSFAKMIQSGVRFAERPEAIAMLKIVEWEGYDTAAGERACPCCGAWKYQHGHKEPIHAYACGLAGLIQAPRESDGDDLKERDLLKGGGL